MRIIRGEDTTMTTRQQGKIEVEKGGLMIDRAPGIRIVGQDIMTTAGGKIEVEKGGDRKIDRAQGIKIVGEVIMTIAEEKEIEIIISPCLF